MLCLIEVRYRPYPTLVCFHVCFSYMWSTTHSKAAKILHILLYKKVCFFGKEPLFIFVTVWYFQFVADLQRPYMAREYFPLPPPVTRGETKRLNCLFQMVERLENEIDEYEQETGREPRLGQNKVSFS